MTVQFDYLSATHIVFGWGHLSQLTHLVKPYGDRVFVVTGRNQKRAGSLEKYLRELNVTYQVFSVGGEPTVDLVENALREARAFQTQLVIGFGGGSVLDTGKALAAMLANDGEVTDYLEVAGKGLPLTNPSIPYIAIPTTSGTGTEVTRNAVLSVPEKGIKVSMRSPLMLPKIALVDPKLTLSMSSEVTASTGLDALTQVMEAFVSNKANPMVDMLCREGMKRASLSLEKAWCDGDNRKARTDMSFLALLSGLALANGGLGAVHGFAGPLGGMISAPHGTICASLLPWVMEQNIGIIEQQEDLHEILERYDEVAQILTQNHQSNRYDGVQWVRNLCQKMNIPTLNQLGFQSQQTDELILKSAQSSSMRGNPVVLTKGNMEQILFNAM